MSVYRITEVGFENTEAVFFRTTIEMASEYDIAKWLWVGDRDADVILVNSDADEYTSNFTIDKPTQSKIRPILISCSSTDKKSDSFSHSLKKPITYTMITTLLLELESELAQALESSSTHSSQPNDINKAQQSSTSKQSSTSIIKYIFRKDKSKKQDQTPDNTHPEPIDQDLSELNDDIDVDSDYDDITDNSAYHDIDDNSDYDDIDDDSDYDIYELLMESELDHTQPDDAQSINRDSPKPSIAETETSSKTARTLKANNTSKVPPRRFLEERRFLGLLRKHAKSKYPTEISHYKYPSIRIYPEQELFAHHHSHELHPGIFASQASGFSILELMKPEEKAPADSWKSMPIWLLFYLATLYGSEGGLKATNSHQDKLSLSSKPDFDIVPNDLDYMVIADYMINKEPQDLNTIAKGSGVDIITVINFCNACEEINIIDRTPIKHSEIRLSKKVTSKQDSENSTSDKNGDVSKGLIKRFMSKFRHTD
jgi:hypothetical protein